MMFNLIKYLYCKSCVYKVVYLALWLFDTTIVVVPSNTCNQLKCVVAWLELMMALYSKGELIDGNSDEEANI
jgi:hypothetical protein